MERSYCLHDFSGSFNRVPAAYAACLCFPDGKYRQEKAGILPCSLRNALTRALLVPHRRNLRSQHFLSFSRFFRKFFVRKTWQGGTAFNLSYLIAAARPACRVFLARQNYGSTAPLLQNIISNQFCLRHRLKAQAALFCKIFLKSASFLCRPVF